MGGFGSGNHGMQQTTETCKRIDIRWLKRKGLLNQVRTGQLNWKQNGTNVGSIGYSMKQNQIELKYRFQEAFSNDWEDVDQTIYFQSTPCNYGGERKWFTCPRCNGRSAVLYGVQKYFFCRKCCNLPYQSQLQSPIDRVIAKKHQLGEQIFERYEYGEGWQKKKGVHHKTFGIKLVKYRELSQILDTYVLENISPFIKGI